MIQEVNAIETFRKNIERTDMLITAVDKIEAYNRIYQNKASEINLEYGRIVTESQNNELFKIEQSCKEHAIISLATAFETYYKELLQQLLFNYPTIFSSQKTRYHEKIRKLLDERNIFDYDRIGKILELKDRFDYFQFFDMYSIPFLISTEEKDFIEYIFIKRNCFVHNAGKIDNKTEMGLKKIAATVKEIYLSSGPKRLRTKMKRLISIIDKRIRMKFEKINTLVMEV